MNVDKGEGLEEVKEEITNSSLEAELEALKEEKTQLINRLQRAHADFANYKKRVERTRFQDKLKYQSELICALLPILDNLERALKIEEEQNNDNKFVEGVDLINKELLRILNQKGLEEIPALEEVFDPNCHDAIERVQIKDLPNNIVTEVLQKGYRVCDKIIRPSLVKVNIGGNDDE